MTQGTFPPPPTPVENPADGTVLSTDSNAYQAPTFHVSGKRIMHTFSGAGTRIYLTLHHTAADQKRVKLVRIAATIVKCQFQNTLTVELVKLDGATLPSGGVALTPTPSHGGDVANTVVQTLPTTQGSVASSSPLFARTYMLAATSGAQNLQNSTSIPVYDYDPSEGQKALEIRPGVAEGWALRLETDGNAGDVTVTLECTFIEEDA